MHVFTDLVKANSPTQRRIEYSTIDDEESIFAPAACFSQDNRHVICGSIEGFVFVWKVPVDGETANSEDTDKSIGLHGSSPILTLANRHPCAVNIVLCSPTRNLMVSSCSSLALWGP